MTQPGTGVPGERLGQADAELLRLEAAAAAVARNLVDLDNNTARKDLDTGPLTGATAAAWAEASDALGRLWDGYGMLTGLVTQARAVRGQRRFTDTDRAAYVEQVLGRSITLSTTVVPLAQRSLLGAGQVTTVCSPAELLSGMEAAFSTAVSVAARAGDAWARLLPAAADTAAELDRVRALTRAAAGDPAPLDDADARLRAFMARLASDPLTCTDADLATVREAVARADADRTSAEELRAVLIRRLAAADTLADEVSGAERAAAEAETAVAGKFTAAVDHRPGPDLRADLSAIDALAAAGHWQLITARLADWNRRARQQLTAAQQAAAHNAALLSSRSELRGRLDAYQAKAARRGWAEHDTLSPLVEAARTQLFTAPCDLDAARAAVAAYQEAIARLTATNAREGQQ
jgi:uncharacterized protein (DUF2267 family)